MEEDKTPNGTFTQVPNMLLDSCDLPETAQLLFFKLLRRVGHTGGVFIGSTRKLANLTNMSKSTVDRGLKTLAKANLLTIGHQISSETEQEVMRITLNMGDIWNVNRYHSKVAPVPNWDNTLPNLDTLPQIGIEQSELGREELDVSANSDEDREKTSNTNNTKKDAPLSFTPEELLIFQWCVEDAEYEPKVGAKNKEYCSKLVKKGIVAREQYNALRDVARSMIHGEDKTVYLGNIASVKTLNAWEKQSQQTSEPEEDDIYYQGMDIPANISRNVERACKKKWGMSVNRQALNETFKDIGIPPKSFILLLEEVLVRASDPDDLLVRMKQRVTSGIL